MSYCTFSMLGRYGRFANQLFQIAGTIGIARRNGLQPVFPQWVNYDHKERFGSNERVEVYKQLVNPLPGLPDSTETFQRLDIAWGYNDTLLPSGNYDLSGHLQSYKYFEHCIDEVRRQLTFRNEFPRRKYVAVHVRRGDYDNKYHPRLGMGYYGKAVAEFPTGTVFQVFSDSIEEVYKEFSHFWAEAPRWFDRHFRFVNYDEPVYDYIESFNLMKSCSGFIIGNSSYSAMAAILSDAPGKKVIAPRSWFGPAYTNITAKDIYCDNWVII